METKSAPDSTVPQCRNEDRSEQTKSPPLQDEPSDASAEKPEQLEEEYKYINGPKLTVVIASLTLVFFLVMLDTSIIATAIPRITSDFHSLPDVGWYGSAYLLASCSLQPLTGKLYTYFSSKYTFLTFLAIFEFGSLLCGAATSSDMLILGRAFAGMGCSGLANGALNILSACVPLQKRPVYLGFMMSCAQIGIVLGPLAGGLLTQYTTWRWCFYINLPIGGVAALIILLIDIPNRTVKSDTEATLRTTLGKLDLLGFATFAPAAIQFLLALEWGGTRYRWDSANVIGLFCGAAGTFCVFLVIEYRKGDAAMVPFSMVRNRVVWSGCTTIFFFSGSMFLLNYYLPIYFQAVRGATPTMSGVYLLPGVISQMIFAILSGFLVSKVGYYLPWSITSGVLMSIGTGLISTLTPTTSTGTWIGYQIIVGAGRGCGLQMPVVAVQNNLPQDKTPIGVTLLIFTQTFGGALFLSLAETIFDNGLVKGIAEYAPEVNVQTVINAGASGVREAVPKTSLANVLRAYNQAISHDFYLGTGAAAGVLLFCWGMGWKNVKKAKAVTSEA